MRKRSCEGASIVWWHLKGTTIERKRNKLRKDGKWAIKKSNFDAAGRYLFHSFQYRKPNRLKIIPWGTNIGISASVWSIKQTCDEDPEALIIKSKE